MVSVLTDNGAEGVWCREAVEDAELLAPVLLMVETANLLRRMMLRGDITDEVASAAYEDLMDWPIEYFGYRPFSERIWMLRRNVTGYDAWYVAVAEHLGTRLLTLDRRLVRASGPTCEFLIPPEITD